MESKSREDFLAWANGKSSSKLAPESMRIIQNSGRFASESLQKRWEAWQASRAALVVELPDVTGAGRTISTLRVAIKECEDAIRAAGITVKGEGDDTQS